MKTNGCVVEWDHASAWCTKQMKNKINRSDLNEFRVSTTENSWLDRAHSWVCALCARSGQYTSREIFQRRVVYVYLWLGLSASVITCNYCTIYAVIFVLYSCTGAGLYALASSFFVLWIKWRVKNFAIYLYLQFAFYQMARARTIHRHNLMYV